MEIPWPEFKAIIFDFNGVIVDDEPLHCELFRKVCKEEGIKLSPEDYYAKYIGFDDKGCFRAVFEDRGYEADGDVIADLVARKSSYYTEMIEKKLKPCPGSVELIAALKGRKRLIIVSGALRDEIDLVINCLKIDDAFEYIVSALDTEHGKPDPEGFLAGLYLLQQNDPKLAAQDCLVIEDTVAGVQAARAAGMRVLAVANSQPQDSLQGADWVTGSLDEVALASEPPV